MGEAFAHSEPNFTYNPDTSNMRILRPDVSLFVMPPVEKQVFPTPLETPSKIVSIMKFKNLEPRKIVEDELLVTPLHEAGHAAITYRFERPFKVSVKPEPNSKGRLKAHGFLTPDQKKIIAAAGFINYPGIKASGYNSDSKMIDDLCRKHGGITKEEAIKQAAELLGKHFSLHILMRVAQIIHHEKELDIEQGLTVFEQARAELMSEGFTDEELNTGWMATHAVVIDESILNPDDAFVVTDYTTSQRVIGGVIDRKDRICSRCFVENSPLHSCAA